LSRDWKKLTFYYFADSYINFNSLVTDLFKIYKTRIWMSAINPASFASPTLGLQAPSGIGPGVVGVSRGTQDHQQTTPAASEPPTTFSAQTQNSSLRFSRPWTYQSSGSDQTVVGPATYDMAPTPNHVPHSTYSPFGGTARPPAVPYPQNIMQPTDHFPTGYPQHTDYQMGRGRFPPSQSGNVQHDQGFSSLGGQIGSQADFSHAFQNLSLHGR
jgi:hypothetical protein